MEFIYKKQCDKLEENKICFDESKTCFGFFIMLFTYKLS